MIELQALAERGASIRLEELAIEMSELQAFLADTTDVPSEPITVANGRVVWSPKQRKAISARMKAYWAKRRNPTR